MGYIRRAQRKSNPTCWQNDVRLSFGARGMLAYLLEKPDHWNIRFTDLVRQSPAQDFAVRNLLRELTRYRYIERVRTRNDDGTYDWDSIVDDTPIGPELNEEELKAHMRGQPYRGNRDMVEEPYRGFPHVDNRGIYKDSILLVDSSSAKPTDTPSEQLQVFLGMLQTAHRKRYGVDFGGQVTDADLAGVSHIPVLELEVLLDEALILHAASHNKPADTFASYHAAIQKAIENSKIAASMNARHLEFRVALLQALQRQGLMFGDFSLTAASKSALEEAILAGIVFSDDDFDWGLSRWSQTQRKPFNPAYHTPWLITTMRNRELSNVTTTRPQVRSNGSTAKQAISTDDLTAIASANEAEYDRLIAGV